MSNPYTPGADAEFRDGLDGALQAVLELQNLVKVACPHPDCMESALATAPTDDEVLIATRTAPHSDEYEELHDSEGHSIFVQYRVMKDSST